MFKKITAIIFVLGLFCVTGCMTVSEEAKDLVLEKDPAFSKVMDNKERVDGQIYMLKETLNQKKEVVDSKISEIRKEFNDEKTKIDSEINGLRHQLDPERDLLKNEVNTVKEQVRQKNLALKDVEANIKNLESLVSKENAVDISADEVNRWRQKISALEEQKKLLRKELKELRDGLAILETKLKLLM